MIGTVIYCLVYFLQTLHENEETWTEGGEFNAFTITSVLLIVHRCTWAIKVRSHKRKRTSNLARLQCVTITL